MDSVGIVNASKVKVRKAVATITANKMASPHCPSMFRLCEPMGIGPTHLYFSLNAKLGSSTHGTTTMIMCSFKVRLPKAMLVFTL